MHPNSPSSKHNGTRDFSKKGNRLIFLDKEKKSLYPPENSSRMELVAGGGGEGGREIGECIATCPRNSN